MGWGVFAERPQSSSCLGEDEVHKDSEGPGLRDGLATVERERGGNWLRHPCQNAVNLCRVHVQAGPGPDHIIRPLHLPLDGPLGLDALPALLG